MASSVKTISFKALQRCRTTIEDFAASYFPLHGLGVSEGLCRFLDVLLFVEATIYQMDEENEALCSSSSGPPLDHTFQDQGTLLEVLQELGLLDDRITSELMQGLQYWRMERRVCGWMQRHVPSRDAHSLAPGSPGAGGGCSGSGGGGSGGGGAGPECAAGLGGGGGGMEGAANGGCGLAGEAGAASIEVTAADVVATHERKSFDYRVLHLLLHRLLHHPYDEQLLAFMQVDEMLVDIGDDLVDYEDDVVANSFNIYRAFVHVYGSAAQLQLVERITELEARRAALLALLPGHVRYAVLQRQVAAAVDPGSDKWVFAAPIFNEVKFREQVLLEERAHVQDLAQTQKQLA